MGICEQEGRKPLRRDAERNRQRILAAARELVAVHGLGVSHDQLAEAADVAVGTVYRRFPDKESLIDALFAEEVDEFVAVARSALAIKDPWCALVAGITEMLQIYAGNRGLKELTLGKLHGLALACRAEDEIGPIIEELVSRAHTAGVLRPDVGAADFGMVPIMVGAIIDSAWDVDPELWRRSLALVLSGFRAQPGDQGDGSEPLPGATPTMEVLGQIKSCWRPPSR